MLASMNRLVALLACTALGMTGCSANQVKQTGGSLAATSALLVALPLIPFSSAYHELGNTSGKSAARFDAWRLVFDPVYSAKTSLIRQRDPVVDARTVASEGAFAYLPSIPGFSMYPSVGHEEPPIMREANNKIIETNELLRYLQILMADDPKDNNAKETGYRLNKETAYPTFSAVGFTYKEVFNKEMIVLKTRALK